MNVLMTKCYVFLLQSFPRYPAVLHIGDIRIQADIESKASVIQATTTQRNNATSQGI